MSDEIITLAIDTKTHRPGCVLIQAAFGFGAYRDVLLDYSDLWLLAPTDNMRPLRGKKEEFRQLFELVRMGMKKGKKK